MPKIIINNAKWKVNSAGDLEVDFDVPVVSVPPVVVEPPKTNPIKLEWESGPPTSTQVVIHDEPFMVQSPNKSYSVKKAKSKFPVYRFEVNGGDVWKGTDGKSGDLNNKNRERSEMYLKGANLPDDKDVWISYSIFLEEDTTKRQSGDFIYLGQMHASEDKGDVASNPVFGFLLSPDDELELVTSSATDRIHTDKPKAQSRAKFALEKGKWYDIVVRVVFDPKDGQIQLWVNNKEVVSLKNIGVGYNDTIGPYWKFGVYRSPMSGKIAVQYANMEVGKSESLISRITKPLEII